MSASQDLLFVPATPDHRLSEDHEVRLLARLVEEAVGPALRSRCLQWGGFPYDPVRMFSVLMYALMKGERSSRRMEELCKYDIRFWVLSGGVTPDHSKFARFRKALDTDGDLDRLMSFVVEKAVEKGLVKGKTFVVDGTKMPTSASQWRQYLRATQASDAQEGALDEAVGPTPAPAVDNVKPQAMHKAPWDVEARTMKTTHGEYVVGYNMQIAVEAASGIVVGALATNAANDSGALGPLLAATKLHSSVSPERIVADKGYDSADNYQAVLDVGAKSYISPKQSARSPFSEDKDGVLRCLAGHPATCIKTTKSGAPYLTYRVSKCRNCPLAQACGKKTLGHQREISVRSGAHALATQKNRRRCQTKAGRKLLKCRGQTVERTNARIKRDFRMRRLHLKGLDGARIELLIACIALNLQTLLRAANASLARLFTHLSYLMGAISMILTANKPLSGRPCLN